MGNDMVKASIIIPHYNARECLQRLFPTLVNQTFKDFEVIVIDDCSPDKAAVEFIKDFIDDKPWIRLVQNPTNMRFVRTCNRGIELAKGEYVCFLNQDTEVRDNFVQRNVEILDADPGIGGLTCSIVDQNGRNWFTGGRYEKGVPRNLLDDFEGIRTVDFIAGTSAFYRKDVFDRIGMFDVNYIMYHEDVEYGLRVKKHTLYRVCTFSDKLVTHVMVPSLPRSDVWFYDTRNLMLIAREYSRMGIAGVIAYTLFYGVLHHMLRAAVGFPLGKVKLSNGWLSFAYASFRGAIEGMIARKTTPLNR